MINESGLQVTADKVLIYPAKVKETSQGGIVLATMTKEREDLAQVVGTVIDMGGTCKLNDANGHPLIPELEGIEVGDTVLFAKYSGTRFPVDGVDYVIMRARDILGKADRLPDSVLRGAQSSAEIFGINKAVA